MAYHMTRVLGVDVGGTYTDLFLFDEATGRVQVGKVPSTRGREADGLAAGIAGLIPPADLSAIVHGTTVGTNALVGTQGRPRRPHHDGRVPRRARDAPPRPPADLGADGQLRPGDRTRHARRSARTHARRRHDPYPGRPRRRSPGRRRPARQRRRSDLHRVPAQLRKSGQRTVGARRRARHVAEPARGRQPPDPARDARVRAHQHDRSERRVAACRGRLPGQRSTPACGPGSLRASS